MIVWARLDQRTKITEALGVINPEKSVTLSTALEGFVSADGVLFPKAVKAWSRKILEIIDGKRDIKTLTVKDAQNVFETIDKNENEATAYRARATLSHAVRYAFTGEMPEPKPQAASANGDSEDLGGKMKFSAAKITDIMHLVPLYSMTGRFGWIKAEVQKQIHSLQADQAGIIEAPKRSMTPKESRAILSAVSSMFSKGNLSWTIRYNPNESVFIFMRNADLDKLVNKNKAKKGA